MWFGRDLVGSGGDLVGSGRVWWGLAESGPVGLGPATGKTFAVTFPNLLHQVVSLQTSLFLVHGADVLELLVFGC